MNESGWDNKEKSCVAYYVVPDENLGKYSDAGATDDTSPAVLNYSQRANEGLF